MEVGSRMVIDYCEHNDSGEIEAFLYSVHALSHIYGPVSGRFKYTDG